MKDKTSYRTDRVAKLLSSSITKVLDERRGFMKTPMLAINHIKMSPDLKLANVYFSFYTLAEMPSSDEISYEKEVEDILNAHAKLLRREISGMVYLKSIPELRFHYDQLLREADKILDLIDRAKDQ